MIAIENINGVEASTHRTCTDLAHVDQELCENIYRDSRKGLKQSYVIISVKEEGKGTLHIGTVNLTALGWDYTDY